MIRTRDQPLYSLIQRKFLTPMSRRRKVYEGIKGEICSCLIECARLDLMLADASGSTSPLHRPFQSLYTSEMRRTAAHILGILRDDEGVERKAAEAAAAAEKKRDAAAIASALLADAAAFSIHGGFSENVET